MIRLQDIAEMAGVSRTTVSNVINGNTKRVSQKTIDKITAILKEQNYVPHMGLLVEPPSTRMHSNSLAPVLSATFSLLSCCIMQVNLLQKLFCFLHDLHKSPSFVF